MTGAPMAPGDPSQQVPAQPLYKSPPCMLQIAGRQPGLRVGASSCGRALHGGAVCGDASISKRKTIVLYFLAA